MISWIVRINDCSFLAQLKNEIEIENEEFDTPGYDLFDPDSDTEDEPSPGSFTLPSSDNESNHSLEHYLVSPNENPLPITTNRGVLNPTSNWLQSGSEADSDLDQEHFLLNANAL